MEIASWAREWPTPMAADISDSSIKRRFVRLEFNWIRLDDEVQDADQ